VRNLRLIITLWLASFAMPGISFALGLGEIDISSFLNQPLKAEIEVISARPGEIDDLLVSLASRDSFARAGLSRPDHLSDLRFAVKKNESGDQATILVTSRDAIKEPFLNFLVEADWSKGRVLREFTVLLDPPFFAESAAPALSASANQQSTADSVIEPEANVTVDDESSGNVIATVSEEIAEPIARSSEANATGSAATEEITNSTSSPAPGNIVVGKGDALWTIASQFKDVEHSMGQVMLAIQRANPDAFSNNNINNLKIGAVFRAPTVDELDQLNKQEAYAQVLEQNGLWDDYVARVTGTSVSIASGDGGSDGADEDQNASGNLSLLTPDDSESAGQGEGGNANDLKNQLALAEEQLDASRIENQQMQSRIADLEARLSKFDELQKMVEIEDDSLAQLQADQSENITEDVIQPDLASSDGLTGQETESPSSDSLVDEMQLADEEALLNEILSEGAEGSNSEQIETAIVEEEAVVAPPAPVIVTESKQSEPSIFDGILPPGIINLIPSMSGLLNNPIALGGLGGVVILLLGLVLYQRRKDSEDEDEDEAGTNLGDVDLQESSNLDDDPTPVHLAERSTDADTNINVDLVAQDSLDDEDDEFSRTAVIPQVDMAELEPEAVDSEAPAEQDDVLNEVDVYLAYGLYDNAEELLKQSLDANPGRADYRSKLLDTYFATKNVGDFSNEAELLKSMGSAGARYWDKVQVMGYELAPDNALFSAGKDSAISAADLEVAKPEMADFDLGASEDDTNFSTTDFNLGEDSDDFSKTQVVKADEDADTQELPDISSLDDLPSLEEDLPSLEEELPSELGELEFTLDDAVEGDIDDISEINFDISDDQDLSADSDELEDVSLDFDINEAEDLSSEIDLDLGDVENNFEATAIIAPIDQSVIESESESESELELESESDTNFNLGMNDTSLISAINADEDNEDIRFDLDVPVQETDLDSLDLDLDGLDNEVASVDSELDLALDDSIEIDEESLSFDMDLSSEYEEGKTGTFAPGDFDDPDESFIPDEADIDDIGDLMLPDDVDEVSTKLDLARAFIDMGDAEGARGSLEEVLAEGTDEQKAEASDLIEKI
jgi:pilus assembly protein FimV